MLIFTFSKGPFHLFITEVIPILQVGVGLKEIFFFLEKERCGMVVSTEFGSVNANNY